MMIRRIMNLFLTGFIFVFLFARFAVTAEYLPGYVLKSTPSETYQVSSAAYQPYTPAFGPWYAIGPFEKGNKTFGSADGLDLKAEYKGIDDRPLRWEEMPSGFLDVYHPLNKQSEDEQRRNCREFFGKLAGERRNGEVVYYLWRDITTGGAHDKRILVKYDNNCSAGVYLSGKGPIALKDGHHREICLSLEKGHNGFLVRVDAERPDSVSLFFRLENSGEQQVRDLSNRVRNSFRDEPQEIMSEYRRLFGDIVSSRTNNEFDRNRYNLLMSQVFRKDAMILPEDRDPLDVVLRRSRVLLDNIVAMKSTEKLKELSGRFDDLVKRSSPVAVDASERWGLFKEACTLRREIAFANPLLDFNKILFLKRSKSRYGHMCDQFFGFHAIPKGGVYVLSDPFGTPVVQDSLKDAVVVDGRLKGKSLAGGSFLSLELDYDAGTMLFAWTEAGQFSDEKYGNYVWKPESTFHIFKAALNINGLAGDLTQMTDGPVNDFDPCFLPNGRIVFISERRGGFGRCHGRPVPTYTLHSMMPDGSDIIPLSYHETNEWHPSVDNNGMIIYARWDYVDRDDEIQSLWLTYPDGRDARSYHANYPVDRTLRPWMEMHMRAIPGSHSYIAVTAAHHGQSYGGLVIIDQRIEDDNAMSQVKRFTPYIPFPEGESGWDNVEFISSPWPLNEDYNLCVYGEDRWNYGIYLVDSFGNRELIYRDPDIACHDPIPLRPRFRPPVVPNMTTQAKADKKEGESNRETIVIMNIYDSDFEWPEGTKIKELRIVQLFPKTTPHGDHPSIGAGGQALARGVIGTVPVEEDGSVYFEAPVGVPIYFQALNEKGLAVQNMRSATYVHRGERLVCQGCHEPRHRPVTATKRVTMALKREPSKIKQDVSGSWPVFYPELVQKQVIDKKCLPCHTKERKGANLAGIDPRFENQKLPPHGEKYSSFHSLAGRCMFFSGGNGSIMNDHMRGGGSRSVAGRIGALGSPLYHMLAKGHHDVNLTDEEMHRLTLWMDTNCMFFGDYLEIEKQYRGERVAPVLQ